MEITNKIKTTQPSKADRDAVKIRDKECVYCGNKLLSKWNIKNLRYSPTLEHLNHRQEWDSVGDYIRTDKDVTEIVARCCHICNTNRGTKPLRDWFKSAYCLKNRISEATVANVVKKYLGQYEPI